MLEVFPHLPCKGNELSISQDFGNSRIWEHPQGAERDKPAPEESRNVQCRNIPNKSRARGGSMKIPTPSRVGFTDPGTPGRRGWDDLFPGSGRGHHFSKDYKNIPRVLHGNSRKTGILPKEGILRMLFPDGSESSTSTLTNFFSHGRNHPQKNQEFQSHGSEAAARSTGFNS